MFLGGGTGSFSFRSWDNRCGSNRKGWCNFLFQLGVGTTGGVATGRGGNVRGYRACNVLGMVGIQKMDDGDEDSFDLSRGRYVHR